MVYRICQIFYGCCPQIPGSTLTSTTAITYPFSINNHYYTPVKINRILLFSLKLYFSITGSNKTDTGTSEKSPGILFIAPPVIKEAAVFSNIFRDCFKKIKKIFQERQT